MSFDVPAHNCSWLSIWAGLAISDEKPIIYCLSSFPTRTGKTRPLPQSNQESSIVPQLGDSLISYSISLKHDCMPSGYKRYSVVAITVEIRPLYFQIVFTQFLIWENCKAMLPEI